MCPETSSYGWIKFTGSRQSDEIAELEGIQNDLSSSYGLLGGALLARREFAAAANAYRSSLELVRGQSIAVNAGQLHHQLGNCEAYLGNLPDAALHYTKAAQQFHAIGMRGYLGNALSEFGHLLLEFAAESDWPSMPNNEIIEAGINDVADAIKSCFSQYPFKLSACPSALRNLFGMIILISFRNEENKLTFPTSLRTTLLPWAEEAVYAMDEIWWDELGSDAVQTLKALLNFEAAIAQFEHDTRNEKTSPIEFHRLAAACKSLGFIGGDPTPPRF